MKALRERHLRLIERTFGIKKRLFADIERAFGGSNRMFGIKKRLFGGKKRTFGTLALLFVSLFPLCAAEQAALLPDTAEPGSAFTVALGDTFSGTAKEALLVCPSGKTACRAAFFPYRLTAPSPSPTATSPVTKTLRLALLAVDSLEEPGQFSVLIRGKNRETLAHLPLVVTPRDFAEERITLDARNTEIRAKPEAQKTRESEALAKILWTENITVFTTSPFITPLPAGAFHTSNYGDRRTYLYANGKTATSVHAGIDYRAATGTPVKACAAGRVVFAAPRIVTGNTVVIEHLPGVYSLSYHLDRLDVETGTLLAAGAIIGTSGATGLATGPHLHWEVRVAGVNTDGELLTKRPLVDTEELIKRMF